MMPDKVTDAVKKMYEEYSECVETADCIPLPFKSWVGRTPIEDFVEYWKTEYIDEEETDQTGIEKALESIAIDMHKQTRLIQELIMTLEKMRKGQK